MRDGSIEIVNAELAWRPGDELVVLSRWSPDDSAAALDAAHGTVPEAPSPAVP